MPPPHKPGNKPGPLGKQAGSKTLPTPKVGGVSKGSAPASSAPIAGGAKTQKTSEQRSQKVRLPVLRQGSLGVAVQKLQRLLNVRISPSPGLVPDGHFGPATHEAVVQFQRGVRIAQDGVVGNETWYHLFKGDKALVLKAPPKSISAAATKVVSTPQVKVALPPLPKRRILEWTLKEKIKAFWKQVTIRYKAKANEELTSLISFENVVLSLSIIAALLIVSGGTVAAIGWVILTYDISKTLTTVILLIATADSEDDFERAADEFVHLLITVGTAAVIGGIARIANRIRFLRASNGAKSAKSAPGEPGTPTPKPPSALPKGPVPGPGVTHPHGFKSEAQFRQAAAELKQALQKSGITDAKVGVRGSAVTGKSSKGGPFRNEATGDLKASDVDFFIESPQLSAKLPPNSKKVPGMTKPDTLMEKMPALEEWSTKWSKELGGREVTPAGFGDTPTGSPIMWGTK